MKKPFLLLLCGLLCAASLNAQTWSCGDPKVNGGSNVTATLSNGTLTISGKGAMKNYGQFSTPPWSKNNMHLSIHTVIIKDGVTTIGNFAFWGCKGLTSVSIPNSVTSIGLCAFLWCSTLTSVTIPNSVISIGESAFNCCFGLTSVTIGSSVTTIGYQAFWNSDKLTSITIQSPIPPAVKSNAFPDKIKKTCCLYVPSQEAVVRYRAASRWKNFSCVNTIDYIKVKETPLVSVQTVAAAEKPVVSIPQVAAPNVSKSEVDINIPATGAKNENTFAVIIANESYQEAGVSQVDFALNDGMVFKEYCIKTLGLPEQNIRYRANATLNNIRAEVSWLSRVANAYNGKASIIFYYAGHGIPDESSRTSYLLPVDGYGSDVASAYKLDDLYQTLGNVPAKSVVVFMDACFSGAGRNGQVIASARGVAVKAKPGAPVGNMVVFASSQGDETSYPYREKGHGLFTYFLLKKLQETKGNVTLGELESYLSTNVVRQSVVVNSKSQTPTATPSRTLGFAWEDWKLK